MRGGGAVTRQGLFDYSSRLLPPPLGPPKAVRRYVPFLELAFAVREYWLRYLANAQYGGEKSEHVLR